MDHFPRDRDETEKWLKPPPSNGLETGKTLKIIVIWKITLNLLGMDGFYFQTNLACP